MLEQLIATGKQVVNHRVSGLIPGHMLKCSPLSKTLKHNMLICKCNLEHLSNDYM